MRTLNTHPIVIVLMGVSGSGKSTVGTALADILGWQFYEGDDFHSESNVKKMAQGTPLTDEDREPWLANLHDLIAEQIASEKPAIIACSALKQKYRDQLLEDNEGTMIVYLRGDYELIDQRMQKRQKHYMKADMLQSQFDALEEPENAIVVSIEVGIDKIVDEIINTLNVN